MPKGISDFTANTFLQNFASFCRDVVQLPTYPVDIDGSSIVWSAERPTEGSILPLISLPNSPDRLSPARKLFFEGSSADADGNAPQAHKLNTVFDWRFAQLQGLTSRAHAYYKSLEDNYVTVRKFIDQYVEWGTQNPYDKFSAGSMLLCFSHLDSGDVEFSTLLLEEAAKELARVKDFAGAAMIYELIKVHGDRLGESTNADLTAWERWADCLKPEKPIHPACIFQGASLCMLGFDMANLIEPFLHAAISSGQSNHPAQDSLRTSLSHAATEYTLDENKWINIAFWLSRTMQLSQTDDSLKPHLETLGAYKERADELAITECLDLIWRIPEHLGSTTKLNNELSEYAQVLLAKLQEQHP